VSLPVNARIQAAQSFVRNVRSAQEFLRQQDATTAETRYGALLARLKEAHEHLRWNPAAGRPARFLDAHSAQGQGMAARAIALATAHGVPELPELVVKPYESCSTHTAMTVWCSWR
jgi:hypothetical protein